MFVLLFLFVVFFHYSSAYILYLNESDYARMPHLFHLENYESCLHQNNDTGVYCLVSFDLVTDEPSELYNMINNYSDRSITHFNHSKLTYGLCLTTCLKTCNKFYKQNTTLDPGWALEGCLNETLWRDFKLKTRVDDGFTCETVNKKINIDAGDISIAAIMTILLILNFVGSLYGFFIGDNKNGNSFWICFSIGHNWRRLVASAAEGPEPRLSRLKGFYGIKSMTIMFVIMVHSMLPAFVASENPRYIEEAIQNYPIMANGTVVVQTFFVISGFLLVYNMLIDAEKNERTWRSLPQCIGNRWLRLTPAYLLVLGLTATWLRHYGSGPFWQSIVVTEVQDCRRDWWLHPLYINNYFDNSYCMMHTWYIAADFQLYCLGVTVYLLTSGLWRTIVLGLLFVAGVVMPAVHTYYQDLDGMMMLSPEACRNFLLNDPTFNHIYKRGHTNLAAFIVGMGFGMVVYHLPKNDTAFSKLTKHRIWFYFSFPLMLVVVLVGKLFHLTASRPSVYFRMLYAAAAKPLFAFGIGMMIVGMVFKFENVYRRILEWSGWTVTSRLSYCAYVVHVIFVKLLSGTRTELVHLSFMAFLVGLFCNIILSFLSAVPLHLLVEAPTCGLLKMIMSGSRQTSARVEKPTLVPDFNSNDKSFENSRV